MQPEIVQRLSAVFWALHEAAERATWIALTVQSNSAIRMHSVCDLHSFRDDKAEAGERDNYWWPDNTHTHPYSKHRVKVLRPKTVLTNCKLELLMNFNLGSNEWNYKSDPFFSH